MHSQVNTNRTDHRGVVLRLGLLGLLVVLLFGAASQALALQIDDGPGGLIGKTTFTVNVRQQPGLTSPVISTLTPNEEVLVIGRTELNNWVQIEQGPTTGWVAAWLLTFNADTLNLVVTTERQPPPSSEPGVFVATSPYNVNMRTAPRVAADNLITQVPFLDEMSVIARDEDNSWVFVEYEGDEAIYQGWAAGWLLVIQGDTLALPIIDESGTIIASSVTPSATVTTTRTPQPSETPSATPDEDDILISSPLSTNIRSTPDPEGAVLTTMPSGDEAIGIGRTEINNWIEVDYNGTEGWVAAWVVTASQNTVLLPVTSPVDDPVVHQGAITATTRFDTSVRFGPSAGFAQVASLAPSEEVVLSARTADNDWFLIEFGGTSGWIAAWLVIADQDTANLVVEN